MTQAQTHPMSFEGFLQWFPEDGKRYELIEGVVVEMLPTRPHEDLSGFLVAELNLEIRKQQLVFKVQSLQDGWWRSFCVDGREIATKKYQKRSPLLNSVLSYGSTATSATGIGRKYDFLVSPPSFLDSFNHRASSLLVPFAASSTSTVNKDCESALSASSSNKEIIW